jgi:hypothetical protein
VSTTDPELPDQLEPHTRINAALMLSFGEVVPGREHLASESLVEVSRFLGSALSDDRISHFTPYFFADGPLADVVGFFLIEAESRSQLFDLRTDQEFEEILAKAVISVRNIRLNTMHTGSEAGRILNLHRRVRDEIDERPPPSS